MTGLTSLTRPRPDVGLIVLYLTLALPLELWAAAKRPLPGLNYGYGWASGVAYGIGAPVAGYLLWRSSERARLAAYVFFALDTVRSIRLGHPLPLALDVAIVLYLQTPPMRRLYPSMARRARAWRRRLGAR